MDLIWTIRMRRVDHPRLRDLVLYLAFDMAGLAILCTTVDMHMAQALYMNTPVELVPVGSSDFISNVVPGRRVQSSTSLHLVSVVMTLTIELLNSNRLFATTGTPGGSMTSHPPSFDDVADPNVRPPESLGGIKVTMAMEAGGADLCWPPAAPLDPLN